MEKLDQQKQQTAQSKDKTLSKSYDEEGVIPITSVYVIGNSARTGEQCIIMPAAAANLPVPPGIHVDAATKTKIWSNQFIDLSSVTGQRANNGSEEKTFQLKNGPM